MKLKINIGVMLTMLVTACAPNLFAQLSIPSDGSDGALVITSNTVIDLSQAVTANWDANNTANMGKGIYDSNKWAVVFKYSSVNVQAGRTVTFINHASHAPVVWLVSGTVVVNGVIELSGKSATSIGSPDGGPGGFRGSQPPVAGITIGSAGYGPGGGRYTDGAGSFGGKGQGNSGPTYGNASLLPLIGGSGGAIRYTSYFTCGAYVGGGGGGGAILIACPGTMQVNGQIIANGGAPQSACFNLGAGGSGGGIRLVADKVLGSGTVRAVGGAQSGEDSRLTGGNGRIRIEANEIVLADQGFPSYVPAIPDTSPQIWPAVTHPTLQIVSVGTKLVSRDPRSSFNFPQDVIISDTNAIQVALSASNLPTNWVVQVRVVQPAATDQIINANFVAGDETSSTWSASAVFPTSVSTIQAIASSE